MQSLFTVHALVHDAANRFGAATAVADSSRALSFTELRDAAVATAARLAAIGVERRDRVGVCMEKSVDQVVAFLAVLLADPCWPRFCPGLKHDNIEHIVRDSGMRAAVSDDSRSGELRDAVPSVPLLRAADLCAYGEDGAAVPERAIGSDLGGIIYSSGSTGRPEGIMVTYRNFTDGARITARYLGTRWNDRIGCVLSLNFDYGLNQLWQSLLTGARLYLHTLLFPADLFRWS